VAPILISSRIFLPATSVDQDLLSQHYEVPLYDEAACGRCPIYKDGKRHDDENCSPCAAFKGVRQLWRRKRFQKTDYIALPPGQPRRVERIFRVDLSKAIDHRPELPFDNDLQFTGELFSGQIIKNRQTVDQVQVVADWLKHKGGIIEVPPRGGKTVMAAAIACHLGLKTIIIAHERHLLKQFRRAFRDFTNLRQLERGNKQPVVKIIDKMRDFTDDLDIALVNYQKFIRDGSQERVQEYLNGKFSLLIVDECHMQGALRYAQFIARLNMRYRCGLSATPDRKDGQSYVVREYLGPTVAKSLVTAMVPKIELFETNIAPKYKYKSWVYAMQFLAKNAQRNKLIVREVFKDLRAGHTIIIPTDFVKPSQDLVDAINRQAELNNEKRGENWPDETAVLYSNQIRNPADLQKILGRVDKGRHRVLVAIRKKIKMGIDLSTPTMLYCVVPMSASSAKRDDGSNIGAPMFYQLSHRVSTWTEGKQQPIIKLFIDGLGQSFGCFKSLFWKEIVPGLRHSSRQPAKYKMDKVEFDRGVQIAQAQEYIAPGKAGQRLTSAEILSQAAGNNPGQRGQRGQRGFAGVRKAY